MTNPKAWDFPAAFLGQLKHPGMLEVDSSWVTEVDPDSSGLPGGDS